jgi:integrase
VYYAVFKAKSGKQYKESLKTRDHGTAMNRYGPAMQRLKDRANAKPQVWVPPAPDEVGVIGEQQPDGSFIEKEVTATELYEPEELELSWDQAFQIHNRRLHEKRGKAVAEKTKSDSQRIALEPIKHIPPCRVTVQDVQRYTDQLRDQGLAPATVGQRHGMLKAVLKTLIAQGYLSSNPFDRVDASFKQTNHIPTATPEEVKQLWDTDDWWIRVLLYTGLRESELRFARQIDVDGQWLHIVEYPGRRLKNEWSVRDVLLPEWAGDVLPKRPGSGTILARVKRAVQRLSVHSTRHTFRTACRSARITTELAERMLGHASEGQIATYGEFRSDDLEPAFRSAWEVMDSWIK